jgi:phosphatidylserine decarboxylase
MGGRRHDDIDARYQRSFGVRAGYLPKDRAVLDQWHTELVSSLRRVGLPTEHKPSVQNLVKLLDDNPIIRMYVTEMIDQVQYLPYQENRRDHIKSVPELLAMLDTIVTMVPTYKTKEGKDGIHFPMSALFAYMMMTPAGEAVFRDDAFNEALRVILAEWCSFLNSDRSCDELRTENYGWLSPDAVNELQLNDYVTKEDKQKPHWGFTSWNNFFHRQFTDLDKSRPVSESANDKVIVSANDGHVYNFAANVKKQDTFWAKGQPYSLSDMLNGQHLERFIKGGIGADVIQSFLSGNDYHRFVAPITGTVIDAQIVPGLMFSNAESAGFDPGAGVLSQGYEVAVNTRWLVFIESPPETNIGMVCVIPIGITEVSSITLIKENGDELEKGTQVKKGDQLGYFSFGGSTLCMVFQPGVIDYYTLGAPDVKDPNLGPQGSINSIIRARKQIALAKALSG